uniref:Uncharacterized protein n=1 Tax=Mus musculus TaxID=10090 RepID=Q9D6J8_MOUSE|nr:unnamed protein product [Mus musculus]
MPSSCLIWCRRLLCIRTGEAGSSRPWRLGNVVLFRLALGASAWNTGDESLRPWIRGALLDLRRPRAARAAALRRARARGQLQVQLHLLLSHGAAGRRGRCSVRALGLPFPAAQGAPPPPPPSRICQRVRASAQACPLRAGALQRPFSRRQLSASWLRRRGGGRGRAVVGRLQCSFLPQIVTGRGLAGRQVTEAGALRSVCAYEASVSSER